MLLVNDHVNSDPRRMAEQDNLINNGVRRNGHVRKPYIQILEQPAPKALRFRYECEGRSAGSIPGVNSTNENKTYPQIKIVGYSGPVVIVVSCVTKDQPYRAHPHNIVGREGCRFGIYSTEINSPDMVVTFQNLGIQCVKRRDIGESLGIRKSKKVDPFGHGFDHSSQPNSIDLNSVRLCFQAYLVLSKNPKTFEPLEAVVSDPIYDKKAMSDLVITKLSHCSASVKGGQEIILLCEKVAKEDIQVRFYVEQNNGDVWEALGLFTPSQVWKQVAIILKTPQYPYPEIESKIQAYVQLRRPSDGATSLPYPFFFTPDYTAILRPKKRQRVADECDERILGNEQFCPSPPIFVKTEPYLSPDSYRTSPISPLHNPTPSTSNYSPFPPIQYTDFQREFPPIASPGNINQIDGNIVYVTPALPNVNDVTSMGNNPAGSYDQHIYNIGVNSNAPNVTSLEQELDSTDLMRDDASALSLTLSQALQIDAESMPREQCNMSDSLNMLLNDTFEEQRK